MKNYIYLAGPVANQSQEEATVWRSLFSDALQGVSPNLVGVSPVRYEADVHPEDRFLGEGEYDLTLARQITAKNRLDVKKCSALLAYMPTMSTGTLSEIGWAYGMEKPIIIVSPLTAVTEHPVLMGTTPWIFDYDGGKGFRHAMEVIRGLFEVYC